MSILITQIQEETLAIYGIFATVEVVFVLALADKWMFAFS